MTEILLEIIHNLLFLFKFSIFSHGTDHVANFKIHSKIILKINSFYIFNQNIFLVYFFMHHYFFITYISVFIPGQQANKKCIQKVEINGGSDLILK